MDADATGGAVATEGQDEAGEELRRRRRYCSG